MHKLCLLIAASSCILISSCAHITKFGVAAIPNQVVDQNSIKAMSKKYTETVDKQGKVEANSWVKKSEECLTAQTASKLTYCKNYRNGMIAEIMYIVDYNYHSYEGNLLAGRAVSDFYFSVGRTALETASTLFTPVDTKSILSALAVVSGTVKDSADESFYFKQTGTALIDLMRADRKTIEAQMIEKHKMDYVDYPVSAAMRDLASFYRAGTMASAVSSLTAAASAKESDADKKLADAKKDQVDKAIVGNRF